MKNRVPATAIVVAALAASALVHPVFGQQIERKPTEQGRSLTQYSLDTWDDRHGLPQNSVQAIAQTTDGYLWLGTQHGIARFDGARFVTFDGRNSPALKRAYVWALAPGRNGSLWIGSEEGGLVHYQNDRFTAFSKKDGLPSNWVSAIHEDVAGNVWVGTIGGGLAVRRKGAKQFEAFNAERGFPNKNILALAADTGGIIWAAYPGGLARIRNDRAEILRFSEKPPTPVFALAAKPGGGVYAAVAGKGIVLVQNHEQRVVATMADGLPGPTLRALAVDESGAIWAGNQSGVARVHNGRVDTFPKSASNPPEAIASLHVDNEGSVWVGLDGGGLARMRASPIVPLGKAEGLAGDMVYTVLHDRDGGTWIGGGSGVDYMKNGKLTNYSVKTGHLPSDQVTALTQDATGAIWVGTFGGMSRIANGKATLFGAKDGLLGPLVRVIHIDRTGAMWIGSHGGLQRFRPGPPRLFTTKDGLADNFVMTVFEDRDANMWVATRNGLSRFVNGRLQRTYTARDGVPEQGVTALHQDADGTLWLASLGGLARMRNDRFETFTTQQGLCSDALYSVLEDDDGRLWLGSNLGILAVNKASIGKQRLTCKLYDRAAGMRAREVNGAVNPPAARAADGRLWFTTIRGVAIVDPRNLQFDVGVPPVHIEEVIADGKRFERMPAELPAGVRNVEVHFTGLSFVAPDLMRFRYRLDGYDDKWFDTGNRRVAYFAHLPPGDYTLRIEAANAEGIWNRAGATVAFSVPPLWYQTWLFKAVLIATVATLLYLLYQRRVRVISRRAQALLELAEERGRAEARYRELFDNATDALLIMDPAGRIIAMNRKAEMLTGYTGAATELNVRDLLPHSAEGERIARYWLSGTADGSERVNVISSAGEPVPVEVTTRNVVENGEPVGVQAVVRDVTDRAALERQLRQSQKMEAVGQLAGGVAHDFNNLLTVIRGNGELLISEMADGDPARDDVQQINEAAERAASLTRQLLAFSRKQVVHPRVLDLNVLLRDIEKMLRRLIGEDLTMVTLPAAEPARVVADPGQLEQVLVNLVVNARDAMPKGGTISIVTNIIDVDDVPQSPVRTASGRAVVISVSDTGMGMDAVTQERIFEPFFTTKEPGKGTGLGLSTVFGIVQQAGGQIVCASQPGRGTTFRIYLPYSADGDVSVPDESATEFAYRGSETILLVEDEEPVRALTARVLRSFGYQVIDTRHGADALAAAAEYPGKIDLLLSDVVMPAMNGRVLAQRLTQVRPDIRVLLMSGYTDDEVLRRGLLEPGVAFLQKPFTPQMLTRMVRETLDADRLSKAG